jgi:hypothetical protein
MIRAFPSRCISIERKTQPVVMPAPRGPLSPGEDDANSPWIAVDSGFAAQRPDLYQGIRLVLLALLTFFGGCRPTRGDDPGAGLARPLKMEMLDAVAKKRSTLRSCAKRSAKNENFPYAAAA